MRIRVNTCIDSKYNLFAAVHFSFVPPRLPASTLTSTPKDFEICRPFNDPRPSASGMSPQVRGVFPRFYCPATFSAFSRSGGRAFRCILLPDSAGIKKNRNINNIIHAHRTINRLVFGAAFDNFFLHKKQCKIRRTGRIGIRESGSRGVICNKSHRRHRAMIELFSSPDRFIVLDFSRTDLCARWKRDAALCPGPTEGANLMYAGGFTVDQTRVCRKSDYARPCEKHPTTVDPRRRIRVVFSKTVETKLKFRSGRLFSRLKRRPDVQTGTHIPVRVHVCGMIFGASPP